MIDLHIHSTASDGSFSPTEICQQAVSSGIKAIAITDHDTIDGVKKLIETGIPQNLEFITGVEISAQPLPHFPVSGSLHLLGYGFSIYDKKLEACLDRLKQARADRNPRIIEKLNSLGFNITLKEVSAICGPGQTGRPHIAQAMVAKGFVSTFGQAFDDFLAKGRPAYVDKFRIPCQEAVQLILDAGGIPVLAHPGLLETDDFSAIEMMIDELTAMGLKGIEVYYSEHSPEITAFLANLAREKKLLATGGSDFHGTLKSGTRMGTGDGTLHVDDSLYKQLIIEVEALKQPETDLEKLEQNLGHRFTDRSLITRALRHSSFVNEIPDKSMADNQRLEYLGDAVLGLAIGHLLMQNYPKMNEGELSKLRATLVSESGLALMARNIDLGRFISLGRGELLSRGYEKNSILADTFEAVIAAVYLDKGFDSAFRLIKHHFTDQIHAATAGSECEDYKSMLQEFVQELGKKAPSYTLASETGPDHDKTFEIAVKTFCIECTGSGKSKKAAEQQAAQNALKQLRQ